MIENRRILVLGASGRVGRPLALHLAAKNTVFGVSRFSDPNDEQALQASGVRTIRKDLADPGPGLLDGIPQDVDYLVNQAVLWKAEPPVTWQQIFELNAIAGPRILQHCRASLKSCVYGSTGGNYNSHPQPRSEEDEPISDGRIYHTSKIAGEFCADLASRLFHVPTAILRYYFPCGRDSGSLRGLGIRLLKGESKKISKGDTFGHHFTWMGDILRMTERALEIAAVPAVFVNVAGREFIIERIAVEKMAAALGVPARFTESTESRTPFLADLAKMRALLGEPEGTFDQMVAEASEGLRANPPESLKGE